MNFIQSLLPAIEHFHIIGYWIAFFAALLETTIGIGLIIPGSIIILLMGALAAKGYFDLGDLIWFAAIGAIIGDNINYFIGKKYSNKFLEKGFWFIKPKHLKKGELFFKRHGSKSIFFGRFIPSIKEIIPLIAGILGMKRLSFMTWNILGAIGWSLVWIIPGYFFAQSLNLVKIWLTRTGLFFGILFIIFILLYIIKTILIKNGKYFFSFLNSIWQSIKIAIIKNPEVQKLTNRHKKFFTFLKNRSNKKNFFGLPLTLLSLALLYVIILFGGVIQAVINSDLVLSTDIRVANLLVIFRNTELTKIFFWITYLGKIEIIIIFITATILILWIWKKISYIIPLLISCIGGELFTLIGKLLIHRSRPDIAIYNESTFSFPSGHATIAISFYGFIAYALIRNTKKWKNKINIFFITLITIILIGFSRLYLGVHFASDVWGGYLVGAIWLIIAMSISEYLLFKKQKNHTTFSKAKKQILTTITIIISIGLYTIFAFTNQIPTLALAQETTKITITNTDSIFKSEQLKFTETLLGNKQEPLSFIITAKNDKQLVDLFTSAQWSLADDVNLKSVYKISKTALLKDSYPQAPMTPDFWNSEVHNFGFEKSTDSNNVRTRHHARFWKTNYIMKNGDNIYVGSASFDSGIKWGVTHTISLDIDTEREFLFTDLQKTNQITNIEKQQLVDPQIGSNFSGDTFFTDGKTYKLSVNKTL